MGMKYCPQCKEVVVTKVTGKYSQVKKNGVIVKRREITHRVEDGGCGCIFFTDETVVQDEGS